VLLDRYSSMPYHHATPKVGHLLQVKCALIQTPPPGQLAPLVKAHTKLSIAAYTCRAAGYRNGDRCEIRICGEYWQFSVGFKGVETDWK